MSLKNVKEKSKRFISIIHPKRWSIVQQLTVFYTLSIIIILLVISGILYFSLQNSLYQRNQYFLMNKYYLLENLLSSSVPNQAALKQEILLGQTAPKEEDRYYIRILDAHHQALQETPTMSFLIPVDKFPDAKQGTKPFKIIHRHLGHKDSFLLFTGWTAASYSPFLIQIAINVHHEDEIMEDFGQILFTTSLIGIFMAALLGFLLAHRGIRPLGQIIKTVQQISIQQLHERFNPKDWPRELTKLAGHFNEMLARLESSFQQLNQFSADLAHELRTPISSLKGEAEVCLIKERSVNDYQQTLQSALEEYDRLIRLIDGLLFLARAENPHRKISYTKINIRKIILSLFEFYMPIAEENNIELVCIGDATILANELLLQRALHNLLTNALKYTQKGGKITVSVEKLSSGKTQLNVIDNGIGIAPQHHPYLFERFYRADADRSQESGGSGLGLAIVRSIMELHHGQVKIQSALHQGTMISLIFPR